MSPSGSAAAVRMIPAADLLAFATAALERAGAGPDDAAVCAEALLDASLRGIDSHGVDVLLPRFVADAAAGHGRPGAEPRVAEDGAVARVDGAGALGPRTALVAQRAAAALAERLGIGLAVAGGVGYLGALSWVVDAPARAGLVAIAACNGAPFVAPHGGRTALHGTNPIAVGMPAQPDPLVLDMRTNAFSMQDFLAALEAGEPLPEDALRDAEGRPVTDPAAVVASGWDGLVSAPLAGARGYGLAVAIDVLTAGLAGGPIGRELAVADEAAGLSLVVIAIRPSACGPPGRFDDRVAALAGQITATPPAGAEPVRAPGARAAAERRRRLRDGVPCPVGRWEEMRRVLAETIDPPPDPVATGGAR